MAGKPPGVNTDQQLLADIAAALTASFQLSVSVKGAQRSSRWASASAVLMSLYLCFPVHMHVNDEVPFLHEPKSR